MPATTNTLRAAASLPEQIAAQIAARIHEASLPRGAHLSAQSLADRFGVSRSPVQKALELLAAERIVRHETQRGYFVTGERPAEASTRRPPDPLAATYFRIAEDRLRGVLPAVVSEVALRDRYALGQSDLRALLTRMQREGWIHRRRGYGWQFHEMLGTPDALVQTYRLRAALEPAVLTEPGFAIAPVVLERLMDVERRLLDGEIETAGTDALYQRGVTFHETLAQASGNPYMLDALRRVNRIRRLLAYRSMSDRQRYYKQAQEHLEILSLVARGCMAEAAVAMRHHLGTVMVNLQQIEPLLRSPQQSVALIRLSREAIGKI